MRSDHLNNYFPSSHSPDRAPAARGDRAMRPARETSGRSRFVMESHALGAPFARPSSLLFATAIAVGLLLVARRLTD